MRHHILAIDNGTQSVRAMIFDLNGKLTAFARIPLEAYVSPHPGWAEQDPDYYWHSLGAACHALWEASPVGPSDIAGVALTTQRNSVIAVGKDDRALRPAIVWLDQRRTEGLPPVRGVWGFLLRLAGMAGTAAYFKAEAESNWIRSHQPEVWKRTKKLVFLSGYLTHRLTGAWRDSVGCQVGYIPFDYKKQRWAGPHDWRWEATGIEPGMLPELVQPAELLGRITSSASAVTGIPVGTPLVAAAADKACEILGSGALEPDVACLSYGTTATVNTIHQRYVEPLAFVPPYPAAIPGAYALEVQIYRGFWLVSWFKREFGQREVRIAEKRGIAPEALFDELIAGIPAGAQGLILQPFWSPGVKIPGPEARGAIIGFSDVHTRAHIYRAILEGLAYALREGLERTESRSKVRVRELRVAGGGSRSDQALQVTADIFGLPASRPHVTEASGLGAAIDAAVGLGLHPSFKAAISAMTHTKDVFEPNPLTHQTYQRLYHEVYLKMYGRLKPLYEVISSISGH